MDELNLIQKSRCFALPVIFAITGHEAACMPMLPATLATTPPIWKGG